MRHRIWKPSHLQALIAGIAAIVVTAGAWGRTSSDEPSGRAKSVPDFSGTWNRQDEDITFFPIPGDDEGKPIERLKVDDVEAEEIIAGNYDNPILQPWAREIVKYNAETEKAYHHVYEADDSCWPSGVPQILNRREAVQLLQAKDHVVIIYQRDHQVREIWLDQPHTVNPTPSWYGESVGHYEGDTLVVDTIAQKTHRFSIVDNYGTPHTDKLHVVERYRLVDDKSGGKGLEVKFRVEDPGTFTMPWAGMVVYHKARVNRFDEVACAENNNTFNGKPFGPLPQERPQF